MQQAYTVPISRPVNRTPQRAVFAAPLLLSGLAVTLLLALTVIGLALGVVLIRVSGSSLTTATTLGINLSGISLGGGDSASGRLEYAASA